ncbi:MAG TPA: hypothetical protein VG845_09655 [Dehalococcoidia bacterium]|nr:hypothetical protein [Dehalococcoidia bacterium]
MARRYAPAFYLGVNLLLAASIFWLADGKFSIGSAVMLAGGVACIEIGLWYFMMRAREAEAPRESRLVSIMERSAHARRFSIRDESTGLLNRWYLERRLDEEASRCKRYGYSMAVIVLKAAVPQLSGMSIDNWQERSADAAQRCLSVVRNVDLSALLGPFEFAICLVHCDREGAEKVVERLEKELADYGCQAAIALFPKDATTPAQLIDLAQGRLRKLAA